MVTVDCIRGTYEIDAVKLVHDFGKRMNDAVDIGQIEGGLVQGLGWMTMEEIVYNDKGKLLSNALSTYKVPDIHSVPKEITIEALPTDGHPLAIRRSKAVGEPPLMYGYRRLLRDPERDQGLPAGCAYGVRRAVHAGESVDELICLVMSLPPLKSTRK
jgi:xanthine dehydrogenase molybdopterin-binding subunit B